jgi:glycosyltransferase involved in cell wall biosynthesis
LNRNKKNIRVGIDCRDLLIAKTGSKTYLSEILKVSREIDNQDISFIELSPFFQPIQSKGIFGKIFKHIQFYCWKQFSLPILAKMKKCDVLICTDYFLPSLKFGLKHIVVFHDAFFWEYPSHYSRLWLKLFHKWAVPAALRADRILVPSNYVKKQLMNFLHTDPHKLSVVYEAPKTFGAKLVSGNFVESRNPFLLHVGALSKHKNLPFLIRAFKKATSGSLSEWQLILIGGSGNSKSDDDTNSIKKIIADEGLEGKVLLKGYLKDEEIRDYYTRASGYIFPSYNEGFGLPLLEAMCFNLPVAAANNTCLPEIGKDGAIYFNPFNMDELVNILGKIIRKDEDVLRTIKHQTTVLSQYSWNKSLLEITAICTSISG